MYQRLKQWIGARILRYLETPTRRYAPFFAPPIDVLRRSLQPGDILLIEGNTRLSAVIKFLTQSTWSHAALFVGDRGRHNESKGEQTVLLEANAEHGVLLVPLTKYAHFNTRICRPVGPSSDEGQKVIDYALARVGTQYDTQQIFDLARYLFPYPPEALPSDVEVLIVADRGFGDHKLYQVLTDELKFDYLIRFRGNIKVTAAEGETRSATDWVGAGGRMRILRGCAVTADGYPVGAVVCVQAKDMKAPWCLCTSLKDVKAKSLLAKYAKRWGIESSFRDTKDPRFGLGMGESRISSPERRDRLWLINALATALLTLPGAAGEPLRFDKHLN